MITLCQTRCNRLGTAARQRRSKPGSTPDRLLTRIKSALGKSKKYLQYIAYQTLLHLATRRTVSDFFGKLTLADHRYSVQRPRFPRFKALPQTCPSRGGKRGEKGSMRTPESCILSPQLFQQSPGSHSLYRFSFQPVPTQTERAAGSIPQVAVPPHLLFPFARPFTAQAILPV